MLGGKCVVWVRDPSESDNGIRTPGSFLIPAVALVTARKDAVSTVW